MTIDGTLVTATLMAVASIVSGVAIGVASARVSRPTPTAVVCPQHPTCPELARRADDVTRANHVLAEGLLRAERERDEALRACLGSDGGR